MYWILENFTIPSEKNGLIRCERMLGTWRISVNGYDQTSDYMTGLWKSAIRRVPKTAGIKKILFLGFGAGGSIEALHRRFPGCQITMLEWDPAMVELSKKLKLFRPAHAPTLTVGDAAETIRTLQGQFDLIIFDLYHGHEPAPMLGEKSFQAEIARLLKNDGYFLVNVFKSPAYLATVEQTFQRHKTWRFRFNTVALYRHHGRGCVGEKLPEGYQNFRSVDAYWQRERGVNAVADILGEPGCLGLRWHYGPLWLESYINDREPRLDPFDHSRVVFWQPVTRTEVPSGWRRSWLQMNARCTGFSVIEDKEQYWKAWAPHAQRHRRRWLRDDRYVLEKIAFEPFLEAYKSVPKLPLIKGAFVQLLIRKHKGHGALNNYFVVREKKTNQIVAGLATLDVPEAQQSIHVLAFIQPCAESSSASVGLVDRWFQDGIEKGLRFLDFDLFYAFGEPWSWRGFSRFKGQFNTRFVRYPHPLVRWVKRNNKIQ